MFCTNYGSPIVINCQFLNNLSSSDGGGFYCHTNGNAQLEYCFFYNNSAYAGCGIEIVDSEVEIRNCTFVNNGGNPTCGTIDIWAQDFSLDISVILENSLICHNQSVRAIDFTDCDASALTIRYTDLYNNDGGNWTSEILDQLGQNGNIAEDPFFVNYQEGNCHLTEGSPCIDAGNPFYPPDPDGTRCDMGAYYFHQTITGSDNPIGNSTKDPILKVFPNPASDAFLVTNITENATIQIVDLNGKLMIEQEKISNNFQMDISNLSNGLYIVKVYNLHRINTAKLYVIK